MSTAPPVIDTAFLAAASAAELEDWGPLEEAVPATNADGDVPMSVRGLTIWSASDESGAEAGIWECSAGPSYWVQEENEVIYVLSGTLTVTPDGGKPATLRPGDVAVFPRGWRGLWKLHETVRKVYVVF
jgi:uncharacterized cupin superfamily protein